MFQCLIWNVFLYFSSQWCDQILVTRGIKLKLIHCISPKLKSLRCVHVIFLTEQINRTVMLHVITCCMRACFGPFAIRIIKFAVCCPWTNLHYRKKGGDEKSAQTHTDTHTCWVSFQSRGMLCTFPLIACFKQRLIVENYTLCIFFWAPPHLFLFLLCVYRYGNMSMDEMRFVCPHTVHVYWHLGRLVLCKRTVHVLLTFTSSGIFIYLFQNTQ